jgi:predicted DCC family thiol-disulfide oxidoreductase YuxK
MRIVPRPLRDWLYDRVALNRYRLFGRRQTCLVPTGGIADRFLR